MPVAQVYTFRIFSSIHFCTFFGRRSKKIPRKQIFSKIRSIFVLFFLESVFEKKKKRAFILAEIAKSQRGIHKAQHSGQLIMGCSFVLYIQVYGVIFRGCMGNNLFLLLRITP
jgi:hypothetical protein